MDEKATKQMAKMVDAVQPKCDEQISVAMTCSHAGSMSSALVGSVFSGLIGRLLGRGGGGGDKPSINLPNPVFIAVGDKSVYAFDYSPRGFNFKIKKQVARWPRDEVSVVVERTGRMVGFNLVASGDTFPLELATMMGAKELIRVFIEALGGSID
ncbi:MAG: hypothetical protein GY832_22390 [Chloroflexi bacterium]|nr:hypothetical protein [Chloroflexota bacterium]